MKVEERLEVKNNEFLRQFESEIGGQLITLEYAEHPRKIFLTKLNINNELTEKGIDQEFLKCIFDQLAEGRCRVIPTCPQVAQFFKAHKKEYKKLLPIGISI